MGQALINDFGDFLAKVQDCPQLSAGATLWALDTLSTELSRIPEKTGLNDPVVIPLKDVALLATQLLSRRPTRTEFAP